MLKYFNGVVTIVIIIVIFNIIIFIAGGYNLERLVCIEISLPVYYIVSQSFFLVLIIRLIFYGKYLFEFKI